MLDAIVVLPLDRFQEKVGKECNPFLTTLFSEASASKHRIYFVTPMPDGQPHSRVLSAIDYLEYLYEQAKSINIEIPADYSFIFQAEDMPIDITSVSWETRRGWERVAIIPDLYYFNARGYEDFTPPGIRWNDREPMFVWRGSTTGRFYQLVEDLDLLPRYRLCKKASQLLNITDFGITSVVQAADPLNDHLISERLRREDHLKPFIAMEDMANYRYVLDIDGNSNSWNFIMKMRLGCCVLRIGTDWCQWFSSRLVPWVHYVPIAEDLHDLEEKIIWCLNHDAESAAIASRGTAFAQAMSFHDEMVNAAKTTFGSRRPA